MTSAGRVRTVSIGMPRERAWADTGRTAIGKRPVAGPVAVRRLGLEGDQVADTVHHGGPDQAVYAFSRSELDWWEGELGQPLADGHFGENLTVVGMDVDDAEVGEIWSIGTTLLEVAYVRIPCNNFQQWQRINDYDDRAWVRRFTARLRPGAYLRVLAEGSLSPGDAIHVRHRPGHGITISTMFAALTLRRDLLPDLLQIEGLAAKARRKAEKYLAEVVT